MSWVESFEEVLDGLHEDYAECKDPKKSLRVMWNAALEVAYWAINDARNSNENHDASVAFDVSQAAVKSLQEEVKDGD